MPCDKNAEPSGLLKMPNLQLIFFKIDSEGLTDSTSIVSTTTNHIC